MSEEPPALEPTPTPYEQNAQAAQNYAQGLQSWQAEQRWNNGLNLEAGRGPDESKYTQMEADIRNRGDYSAEVRRDEMADWSIATGKLAESAAHSSKLAEGSASYDSEQAAAFASEDTATHGEDILKKNPQSGQVDVVANYKATEDGVQIKEQNLSTREARSPRVIAEDHQSQVVQESKLSSRVKQHASRLRTRLTRGKAALNQSDQAVDDATTSLLQDTYRKNTDPNYSRDQYRLPPEEMSDLSHAQPLADTASSADEQSPKTPVGV